MLRKPISIFSFLLLSFQLHAQSSILLSSDFKVVPIQGQASYRVDSLGNLSIFQMLSHSTQWKPTLVEYPNFGDSEYAHWLKIDLKNIVNHTQQLALITKGLDSLQCYLTQGDSIVKIFPLTGSHIPIHHRESISPYLSLHFNIPPLEAYTLFARIRNVNYRLTASPFSIYQKQHASYYLMSKFFLNSLYIGGMFIIMMFSIMLIFLFRERMYIYYLCCIVCSLVIMLCYNDYYFIVFKVTPSIILDKNLFAITSCLVPVFYLLFAEKFLHISLLHDKLLIYLSRTVITLQISLLTILLIADQPLFKYRIIFYTTMSMLSSISLIYLYRSLQRGFLPAWLFLLATAPVILVVMLETFSDLHTIPVQDIHNFYYYTTLFEMFVLTCGIGFRLKLDQDQKRALQNDILQAQITTQEGVRAQIGADLHDIVGSQLSALKINLDIVRNKFFSDKSPEIWKPIYEMLQYSCENVRNISHRMSSQKFNELGLTTTLKQTYGHLEKPAFNFHFEGMDEALDKFTENVLYVVIIEAINNALKHAQASEISIQISNREGILTLIIEDNGIGFNLVNSRFEGQGLKNIEKRIKNYLRGEVLFDTQLGRGTIIIIKVKL